MDEVKLAIDADGDLTVNGVKTPRPIANPSAVVNGTATNGSTGNVMDAGSAPALADPLTPSDGTQNFSGRIAASSSSGTTIAGTSSATGTNAAVKGEATGAGRGVDGRSRGGDAMYGYGDPTGTNTGHAAFFYGPQTQSLLPEPQLWNLESVVGIEGDGAPLLSLSRTGHGRVLAVNDFGVIEFEGADIDEYQTRLRVIEPTQDNDVYIKNAPGVLAFESDLHTSVTLAGENYLRLTDLQEITADPIDLETSNVTGVLPIENGGTGGETVLEAQTNLGLIPGTDVAEKSFITINAQSGTDPVADTATDTLTLQGVNIGVAGDVLTDIVTFSLSDPVAPSDGTQNFTGAVTASGLLAGSNFRTSTEAKAIIGAVGLSLSSIGNGNFLAGESFPSITTSSVDNTVIGRIAGDSLTSGKSNVFIGGFAGTAATTMEQGVFIGGNAGILASTGIANVFVGESAGQYVTTGADNVFVGSDAGGGDSSNGVTTGDNNVGVGNNAGITVQSSPIAQTGDDNTAVGHNTDWGASPASFRTALGSGATNTADAQIMLGRTADTVAVPNDITVADATTLSGATASGKLLIGNDANVWDSGTKTITTDTSAIFGGQFVTAGDSAEEGQFQVVNASSLALAGGTSGGTAFFNFTNSFGNTGAGTIAGNGVSLVMLGRGYRPAGGNTPTNFERTVVSMEQGTNSGDFTILTAAGGTGTVRNIRFDTGGTANSIIASDPVVYEPTTIVPTAGSTVTAVRSYHELNPGSSVTLSGTTAIANGVQAGQQLQLVNVHASNTVQINDAANTQMNGNFVMGQYDSITFVWSATAGDWVEIARSNN